jgi:hypothetical protein
MAPRVVAALDFMNEKMKIGNEVDNKTLNFLS